MNTAVRTVTKIEANPMFSSKREEFRQLRVAAYCRVSTDDEDQINSYNTQVAFYTEYISSNPKWKFVGIYADEGVTGTMVSKRKGFQDMIKDCEKHKIDLILTKSISRFARNTVESLTYVRKLKAMNIGVMFEEQNINSLTTDSEMFVGLYSVIAQAESENISANVRWGIQQRMKKGIYGFHFKTYGYIKGTDGEPEIVPDEAEVVRKVFKLYLNGYSISGIEKYLTENKLFNREGKPFSSSVIRSILSNEKYVGDLLLQKTYRLDCISKKTVVNNGQLPKYLVSNNHAPIIDRDTFNLVQLETARRGSKSKKSDNCITELGKYSSKYAFSEILFCGDCGSPFRRKVITRANGRDVYWRCINRAENGKKYCKKSVGIKEKDLQDAVCRALTRISPERADLLNAINSALAYGISGDESVLSTFNIDQNIAQLKGQIQTLMDTAGKTEGDKERYFDEISKLYLQITALREEKKKIQIQMDTQEETEKEIKRINKLLEGFDISFTEFDDIVVRRIIDCIKVVNNEELQIIVKGGLEIKEKIHVE